MYLNFLPILKLSYLSFVSFSCKNSLHVPETRPLSNIWFANVFLPIVGVVVSPPWHFLNNGRFLIMVSFAVQIFLF